MSAAALGDLTVAPIVVTGSTAGVVAEVGEPTPAPTQPAGGFEAWEVSPGLVGFIPVFLIALACVGLFLSLTRQMRRVAVRQAQLDAEEARGDRGAGGAHGAHGTGGAGDAGDDGARGGR